MIYIETFTQEGITKRCKCQRDEIPFYKWNVYSNETNFHDQIYMTRGDFFKIANILRKKGSIQHMVEE